jgi:hypothetical protein
VVRTFYEERRRRRGGGGVGRGNKTCELRC